MDGFSAPMEPNQFTGTMSIGWARTIRAATSSPPFFYGSRISLFVGVSAVMLWPW
jgi:hypothetical protein